MSDGRNAKKNGASSEEGEDKPMERRSFLKKIGIAGGAALAHFFVLGKPSTAFGGQDFEIVDGGALRIRIRCRPTTDGDKGDSCFVNEEPKELGDQCFIRQTSQGPKEVGDECQLSMKLGGPIKEVGDKCTPIRGRRNDEMEVGDKCEIIYSGPQSQEVGDRCFVSHQTNQGVARSDICTGFWETAWREFGDECRLRYSLNAPFVEEIGDTCFINLPSPEEFGDECSPQDVGDECFIHPTTNQEFGDECDDGIGDTQPGGD